MLSLVELHTNRENCSSIGPFMFHRMHSLMSGVPRLGGLPGPGATFISYDRIVPSVAKPKPIQIRKSFPETWLWEDLDGER